MARKKKKQPKDITSKILFIDVLDHEGTIRFNPFSLNNKTYRIVGTKQESGKYFHSLLCEETRDYVWMPHSLIEKKIMSIKKKNPPVKAEVVRNPTVEEVQKETPNQRNIFDEVPDVKIEKKKP